MARAQSVRNALILALRERVSIGFEITPLLPCHGHKAFEIDVRPDRRIIASFPLGGKPWWCGVSRPDRAMRRVYCTASVTPGWLLAFPTFRTTGTALPVLVPAGTRTFTCITAAM